MSTPKFAVTHNLVTFFEKPTESKGFEQIIDFLNANPIKYALTINPTIYTSCIKQFWPTTKVKTINGEQQIQALVDKKNVIITETSVRSDLHLDDAEGTECLPTATIFEQLTLMGYEHLTQKLTFCKAFFSPQWKFLIHNNLQCLSAKTTAWNEFSSTMASAIICLATNQKFSFSKYIFDHIMKNLEDMVKFLMFPRFVQVFLDSQVEGMLIHKEIYVTPSHTKKIFANIKRHGKDFSDEHVTTTSNDPLLSGSSIRVESFEDTSVGDQEDAFKQRRMIDELDADEGVALEVSTADPVPTTSEVVTIVGEVVTIAGVETSKPKAKGIMMQDPSETPTPTPIDSSQQPSKAKDKIQAKLEEEERLARQKEEETNIALIESWDNTQAMMDANYELANMVYYLLVEKMYPFTRNILHQMWNDVRLQVDYEVEMAYDLLRLIRRKISEGYVPE
uniref:Synaptobrevin, longin-like domain protein n=1 Tax=Tanacetum cinerariifolium TaxID=118510 RepID=A0A699GNR0_TANCI|nr:hypothetical protein [Tanacetum cinerariifolium]